MERPKHWKGILTIFELIGVIGVAYSAHKGGEKVKQLKLEAEKKNETVTTMDVVKCHVPTITIGIFTVGAITANYKMTTTELAAISAGAAYLAKNRNYLERKARELVGDEKIEEIKDKFNLDQLRNAKKKGIVNKKIDAEETGHGNELFYIPFIGKAFRSNIKFVEDAITEFIADRGDVDNDPVNTLTMLDFTNRLDLRPTDLAKALVWGVEEDGFDRDILIEVKKMDPKDDPTFKLDFLNEPVYIIDIPQYYYPMYDPDYDPYPES